MRRLFSATLVGLATTAVLAQDQAPAGSTGRGYQVYIKVQCYTCRGTVGQGGDRGTGPNLVPGLFPYAAFETQVRAPRQDMPAYRKPFLSDQDLADIYAYLLSIKPSAPAKDITLLKF